MNEQAEETVSKLIAGTLSNLAVIGFGMAISESKPLAPTAGILAVGLAAGPAGGQNDEHGHSRNSCDSRAGALGFWLTRKSR